VRVRKLFLVAITLGIVAFQVTSGVTQPQVCPKNMVPAGPLCVDKYEAIVVDFRPTLLIGNPEGNQFGMFDDDYPCADNGNNCSKNVLGTKIFAASVPGVTPSRYITWFQAQQACANVGKRLLRSGEWQMVAAGTPDEPRRTGPLCNTDSVIVSKSGSYPECVSNFGVYDMVGNVWEWVEDWMQASAGVDGAQSAGPGYGNDLILSINDAISQGGGAGFPAALIRGGATGDGPGAGVFALIASHAPSDSLPAIGFRCAMDRGVEVWNAAGSR
jgi:Sulfatase-modifying factor enzyme 1